MTRRDEIVELALSGWYPFQIADRFKVRPAYVSGVLAEFRKRGVEIPLFSKEDAIRARSAETYERVVFLISNGHPPVEIADSLNVTVQTVYQKIKEARKKGISMPRILTFEAIKLRIPVAPMTRTLLEPHASARGLTPIELGEILIRTIAENDLVNAVLDDGAAHGL